MEWVATFFVYSFFLFNTNKQNKNQREREKMGLSLVLPPTTLPPSFLFPLILHTYFIIHINIININKNNNIELSSTFSGQNARLFQNLWTQYNIVSFLRSGGNDFVLLCCCWTVKNLNLNLWGVVMILIA